MSLIIDLEGRKKRGSFEKKKESVTRVEKKAATLDLSFLNCNLVFMLFLGVFKTRFKILHKKN